MTKFGNFCKFCLRVIYDKDQLQIFLAFHQNPLGRLVVVMMRMQILGI